MYNPMNGMQIYCKASYDEKHLIEYVDNCNDNMYYSIYKYVCDELYFSSTQRALKYEMHRKLAGQTNKKIFEYSPMEYALKFEDNTSWFYMSS